ncbi:GDSL-type esterase/lipase family protein [Parvibaculum sp.]|uniref:GDSL-type esterase/lipase family protein n=1 Tax=Parvibaculum sp. TaxID=2024848 RepID=UPI003299E148
MTGSGSVQRTDRLWFSLRAVLAALLISVFPAASSAASCDETRGLEKFHKAIEDVEGGLRSRPLTILHLGDSHIALDSFTRGLRNQWAGIFGSAGRGLMPGVPFRYYAPDGFKPEMSGNWDIASSLPANATGPFGIQGFRVSSADRNAVMSVHSESAVSRVVIDVYGTPYSGALLLKLGDAATLKLSTKRDVPGLVQLSVPAANVHEVRLMPAGTGDVHVLGWSFLSSVSPGMRYDSFGVVAATASITTRWDRQTVRAQIAAMKPDLVILGFGTNEGFNNGLDLEAYRQLAGGFAGEIEEAAPDASIALLGPFDGARQGTGEACGDGWMTPPKLDGVRRVLRDLAAARGYFFWDGGAAMGGRCAANEWAKADPPLMYADRVHLRPAGAEQLASALWTALKGQERRGSSCTRAGDQG